MAVDGFDVMSLREAIRKLSGGTGQGYVRCNCGLTAKCSINRCSCKLAKISCSSKCHGKSEDAKCINKDVVAVEEIILIKNLKYFKVCLLAFCKN